MTIPREHFGRTGHQSTRVLFGAAALARADQATADRTLEILLGYGINHIDVAASYGDAELRIRPWLQHNPGRFFLATKTGARKAEAAREDLHRSLDREQGLVRWIGVTGHGSQIAASHRRSLERFDFDSVLLPYNYLTMQLPYYAENFEALATTCRERQVAMQTIKSIAARPWLGRERTRTTWYEPLEAQGDIDLAVWWALGRPGIFLNSVGDVGLLPRFLDAASRFERRPGETEMRALMERSRPTPIFV